MSSDAPLVYINRDLEAITKPLRFFLIWPKSNRPEDVNVVFYLKMIACYVPFGIPASLGLFLHVWNAFKDFNLNNTLMDISVVLELCCMFAMFSIYLYNLKIIVESTNQDFEMGLYETFDYRKIIKGAYTGAIITLSSVAAYKYVTRSNCQRTQITNNWTVTCGYMIPKELPFDIYRFPIYELLLLHEIMTLTLLFGIAANCVALMMYFLDVMSTELKNIQFNLKDLSKLDVSDDEAVRIALVKVAKTHNDVIVGVNTINSGCKFINLTHFVMGSMLLAVSLLDVLTSHNMENVIQFTMWLVIIFIVLLACQIVTDEGDNVATTLYDINWYEMSPGNKNLVLFMLMAAQRPLGVDAGPFKTLCLPTFLTVAKATYSYLNLLLHSL